MLHTTLEFILSTVYLILQEIAKMTVITSLTLIFIETLDFTFLVLSRIKDGVVSWMISFAFRVIVIILDTLEIWVKVVVCSSTLEFIALIWVYEKLTNRKVETNGLLFAHCEAECQILQFWEEVVNLIASTSTDLCNSFQIDLNLVFFLSLYKENNSKLRISI